MRAPSMTALSLANKHLVQFVRGFGPISSVALAAAQGVPADGLTPFVAGLKQLQAAGYLTQVSPDGQTNLWAYLGGEPTPDVAETRPSVVPPRQNDLMHGPTWCPPRETNPRPGGADFLNIPSRGYRC